MSHQKWFCKTCPSDYVEEDTKLKWGPYTGEAEINQAVNRIYQEIVSWDKNLCFVPLGKVGKDFIRELTRLIELFTNHTRWKSVALSLVHIFIPLILQKPSMRSRAKENSQYISKRLIQWSEGNLDDILSECQTIQARLKKHRSKQDGESKSKAFTRLMLQGKVSQALKFIDTNSNVTGVCRISEEMIE